MPGDGIHGLTPCGMMVPFDWKSQFFSFPVAEKLAGGLILSTNPAVPSVFYAFASRPADLVETIGSAIDEINLGGVVRIQPWTKLSVSGRVMISEILRAIDGADVFACDLTSLNPNVLFELGYAVARSKRIWISLNNTMEDASRQYRSFGSILSIVGYSPYSNAKMLVESFYTDAPWRDSANSGLLPTLNTPGSSKKNFDVLYLKSSLNTDASISLSQLIQSAKWLQSIVDDPREVPMENLAWYSSHCRETQAVIVHLLGERHTNAVWHNAKCALVAGMARGYSKPVLMLAHEPYETPVDYLDLLRTHATASQCKTLASTWLEALRSQLSSRRDQARERSIFEDQVVDLRRLSVGEAVAENEEDTVDEYFLVTSTYRQIVNSKHSVVVGRRGTGKTANLFRATADLGRDRRNHVSIIMPVDYELHGVIRMLQQSIPVSEKGYLIESLWKFLIFTELAISFVDNIRAMPEHYEMSSAEQQLVELVESESEIFESSFSIRLQRAVERLCDLEDFNPGDEQRARVSERLHDTILSRLRRIFGPIMAEKNKVSILIDNLDKAWGRSEDVPILVDLLIGLIGVSGRIGDELERVAQANKNFTVSIIVFLRSDIFVHVQDALREPDKLKFTRLAWDNPEMLIRVLDSRLTYSLDETLTAAEIWDRFFTPTVNGMPVKDFITRNTLPRPRDVIYLVRTAIEDAMNSGRPRVEERDFISASVKYSQFALDSLRAEDDPRKGYLEAVLYEFAGSDEVLSGSEVRICIERAGVPNDDIERYLDLLCDVNFLALEAVGNQYVLPHDESQRRILQRVARRIAARRANREESYHVSPAFHPILQIAPRDGG